MSDGYLRLRTFFEDISGSVALDGSTAETTAIAARLLDRIYLQVVKVTIITPGPIGSVWRVTDTDASLILADIPSDAAGELAPCDLGAQGRPLKEGEGLIVVCDPPGAVGIVTWDGYRKRTGVGAA